MGLLSNLTAKISESSRSVIQHPARCLRKRLNTNQCDRCLKACPSGAISLEGREVYFNKEKCSDCLSCVAVCPQDAFESCLDLHVAFREVEKRSHSIITCARQKKRSHDEIVIPCVGIFSRQVISYLLFSRCESISIHLSGCGECCNAGIAETFTQQLNELNVYFQGHNTCRINLLVQGDQVNGVSCDRRAYLTDITDLVTRVVSDRFTETGSDTPESDEKRRRVPDKVRLVKELVGKTERASQQQIASLFQPRLIISDACDCCPLCKGICPTGALTIDRTSGKVLKFYALDCSLCGLCAEFCKKRAITLKMNSYV